MLAANSRHVAHALGAALFIGSLGCGSSDAAATPEALYQRGALPVAPWTPAASDEEASAGDGQDDPADEASGGASAMLGSGGSAEAGSGGAAAIGGAGTGGIGGAGGMAGNGIRMGSGGTNGSGGMNGSGGSTGDLPGAMPTRATLAFTTKPQGGRYQPRNIGVVWIQDASGNYVTAIEIWAQRRVIYLRKWLSINPFGDSADAVSSATLQQHKTHSAVWDLKDDSGATVPDGQYTLFVEVTDKDAAGATLSVTFTKGPEPQTVTMPDAPYYTGITLTYE
jgi:hypothetical protein